MPGVSRPERELLNEDGIGKFGAWLKAGAKVEVDADVGVIAILIVGCILDGQDVEGHHDPINGQQHCFRPLVYLQDS